MAEHETANHQIDPGSSDSSEEKVPDKRHSERKKKRNRKKSTAGHEKKHKKEKHTLNKSKTDSSSRHKPVDSVTKNTNDTNTQTEAPDIDLPKTAATSSNSSSSQNLDYTMDLTNNTGGKVRFDLAPSPQKEEFSSPSLSSAISDDLIKTPYTLPKTNSKILNPSISSSSDSLDSSYSEKIEMVNLEKSREISEKAVNGGENFPNKRKTSKKVVTSTESSDTSKSDNFIILDRKRKEEKNEPQKSSGEKSLEPVSITEESGSDLFIVTPYRQFVAARNSTAQTDNTNDFKVTNKARSISKSGLNTTISPRNDKSEVNHNSYEVKNIPTPSKEKMAEMLKTEELKRQDPNTISSSNYHPNNNLDVTSSVAGRPEAQSPVMHAFIESATDLQASDPLPGELYTFSSLLSSSSSSSLLPEEKLIYPKKGISLDTDFTESSSRISNFKSSSSSSSSEALIPIKPENHKSDSIQDHKYPRNRSKYSTPEKLQSPLRNTAKETEIELIQRKRVNSHPEHNGHRKSNHADPEETHRSRKSTKEHEEPRHGKDFVSERDHKVHRNSKDSAPDKEPSTRKKKASFVNHDIQRSSKNSSPEKLPKISPRKVEASKRLSKKNEPKVTTNPEQSKVNGEKRKSIVKESGHRITKNQRSSQILNHSRENPDKELEALELSLIHI
eukprot:TRINITY_DN2962_c0_g1_i2.p1 TRINITY_DN2962_c0_g1~~TRINITY_DN2962_c0_g1_i2.p1  ORF type:complete len:721 (-),score=162.96 TRINITY_DN2962_c0_g1_i2:21-2033(-)